MDPHHPDLGQAVVEMTHAVTRCKFEATDAVSDEIVLTNILRLLRTMATSDVGKRCITDKGICEMVEIAFGMHFQARISELLRKAAEETLLVLTQCMFERLVVITRESEHRESMKSRSVNGKPAKSSHSFLDSSLEDLSKEDLADPTRMSPKRPFGKPAQVKAPFKPFGIPAILEFTRVLITLVDPKDHRHTDTLHRALALRLATRALEIGGQSLAKWVGAGCIIERELERKAPKDRIDLQEGLSMDMTITTEQPATVVSVGASGANYSEVSSPKLSASATKLDDGQEKSESTPLLSEDAGGDGADQPPAEQSPQSPPEALESPPSKAGDESGELQETDFQKLAINIKHMIVDDLTRHLFQLLLAQNTSNYSPPTWSGLNTISLVLRTISTLFSTMREHLIPQQHWFIMHLMKSCESGVTCWDIDDWGSSSPGFSETRKKSSESVSAVPQPSRQPSPVLVPEVRELYLEALLQICRSDTAFGEFYIFHDTNIYDKSHLFEELLQFFAKFSFPDASPGGFLTSSSHQGLAFDGVLLFLRCLAERKSLSSSVPQLLEPHASTDYTPAQLLLNKERKVIFLKGAELFNESAKKGIPFFQQNGFLPDPLTPDALAKFMYESANLSKTVIGDYIARRDEPNTLALAAFVQLFSFEGRRIDEAMRQFLEKFRIPGEAQQIERVLNAFSKRYFQTIAGSRLALTLDDPDREIQTEDDTGVLAFSIIMLNTDQHNPQVRKRMTFQDYSKNVRGLNSGMDFSPEYLKSIYQAIQQNEIVLAEERGGELGFNYEWKELLKRMESIPRLSNLDTNAYDRDLFFGVSVPVLASLFYSESALLTLDFENAQESVTFEKAMVGIQQAAMLSVRYRLCDIFDFIIVSLLRISGLSKPSRGLPVEMDLTKPLAATEAGEKELPKADRWAIDFGQSYRGQIAAVLAFNFLKDFPDSVRSSWKTVISSLSNLFLHQLLPSSLMLAEHFCKTKITLPRLTLTTAESLNSMTESSPRREQGLFSSFAQFLSLSSSEYDDDANDPQSAISHTMALEGVTHCYIEEFLEETRFMEDSTVLCFLESLIGASFVEKKTAQPDGESRSGSANAFSQASVFLLEMMFKIVLRNRDRLGFIWSPVASHLKAIISANTPVILLERACTNVLRLLLRLTHVVSGAGFLPKDELQSDVFEPLNQLLGLPSETIRIFVEHLIAGFLVITKTDMSILSKHPNRWSVLFRALSISSTHPTASLYSFELTCLIISGHPDSPVTAEHFGECVDLLLSFSSGIFEPVHNKVSAVNGSGAVSALPPQSERSVRAASDMKQSTNGALDRALKAIEKLYNLHLIIPKLIDVSGAQTQRSWYEFWLPVLSGLGQQCSHPSPEIRHQAISLLQRLLLSDELSKAADQGNEQQRRIDCFEIVLFPILDELKSLVSSFDVAGGSESLVRGCGLATKVFLHFSHSMRQGKEYGRIWIKQLDYFEVFLNMAAATNNDIALDGVRESLKNAVLVLMADQILVKHPDGASDGGELAGIWDNTWARVDRCYPALKQDLAIQNAGDASVATSE
ncbi:GDP/GTP exchange factor for ARF [Kappamyces sp. JEL0680]|nr:GDP/GTP exchange factor for ARF [Kappamyces sp. JEL0680]